MDDEDDFSKGDVAAVGTVAADEKDEGVISDGTRN
jgi:hypothetical protein